VPPCRRHRRPGLSEHDFIGGGETALLPIRLVSRLKRREFTPAGEAPRPAGGGVAGAHGFEVRGEPAQLRVGQGVVLDVEHRRGETGAHQRIAQIVHVDEMVDVTLRVHLSPGRAQFAQRIATEERREKQAVRLQRGSNLDQRARQVVDMMQREQRDDQIEASAGQRQALDIADRVLVIENGEIVRDDAREGVDAAQISKYLSV